MGGLLEPGALTDPYVPAARNLLATYLGLGRGLSRSSIESGPGWCICRSPAGLAFGNFAVLAEGLDRPETLAAVQARAFALARVEPFRVFMSRPRASPIESYEGVALQQRLAQLAAVQVARSDALGMVPAESNRDRDRVAQFIVRQFFGRQERSARTAVCEATARSPHTLLAWPEPKEPRAATMIVRSPGALGIYNLCVEADLRRRGYGARVVGECGSIAACEGRVVCLQCEPGLEPWYRKMGFGWVGVVEVFARSRTSTVDVI